MVSTYLEWCRSCYQSRMLFFQLSASTLTPPLSLTLSPLYLLSDWLSSVRWMCAFPGQMAVLLLCVAGSHFNTQPSCLAWRAIAWGRDSTTVPRTQNMCVVQLTAWVLTPFFCQGVDLRADLFAKYTDVLQGSVFLLEESLGSYYNKYISMNI